MQSTRTGKYSDHQRGERLYKRFVSLNLVEKLASISMSPEWIFKKFDFKRGLCGRPCKESKANNSSPDYPRNCDKTRS
jgi:hypothetical protein